VSAKKSIYEAEMPIIAPGTYGNCDIEYEEKGKKYRMKCEGVQWMEADKDFLHPKDTLYSQYDLAYGTVLITGLGFGILAKALSEKPEVTSVTIIEIEQDVIDAFFSNNTLNSKVTIILGDASTYESNVKYDCLLPDHYELQSTDWIIKDMNSIAERINHDVFWPWPIEELFLEKTYPRDTFEQVNDVRGFTSFSLENPSTIHKKWKIFIKEYFNSNKYLLAIEEASLIVYIEKHAKHYYLRSPERLD
jgi:hypothetical protein